MLLKDKVAIITGGSRGLGKAIASKFSLEGALSILIATNEYELKKVSNEINNSGGKADFFAGDVSSQDFVFDTVNKIKSKYGKIDILVNCAGIITRTPFEELSYDEWHKVININLYGTYFMCQAVLPDMRVNKSGKVINITSQMAKLPHPGASPSYEVSKAGLVALTRHLAFHYAKHNVYVNAIAPGTIDTGLATDMNSEALNRILNSIPLNRMGHPDNVADCAIFLASSMSDYITGEVIDVNGGSIMD